MTLHSSDVKTLKIPTELHTDLKTKASKEKKHLQDLVIKILTDGLKED